MFGTSNPMCFLEINRNLTISRTTCVPEMDRKNACLDKLVIIVSHTITEIAALKMTFRRINDDVLFDIYSK